ncbi:MAG: hypothetical protein DDT33_01729 [Firmicutes bacterium]|nr:hypothetical protein [Bacillota bacterium]
MGVKRTVFGFGFQPEESHHHFLVCQETARTRIFERFDWQDEKVQALNMYGRNIFKAEMSKHKWEMLEDAVRAEFNSRLKKQKLPTGRFSNVQTPLEQLLGKELLVLVWAVESCLPSVLPVAIRNWLGLAPEERWWLYTMTNATKGGIDDRGGWRTALRYALCEN